LLLLTMMDIVQRVFVPCPVLGAAVGSLIDGATGAASGFLVPAGPLLIAWMFGTR